MAFYRQFYTEYIGEDNEVIHDDWSFKCGEIDIDIAEDEDGNTTRTYTIVSVGEDLFPFLKTHRGLSLFSSDSPAWIEIATLDVTASSSTPFYLYRNSFPNFTQYHTNPEESLLAWSDFLNDNGVAVRFGSSGWTVNGNTFGKFSGTNWYKVCSQDFWTNIIIDGNNPLYFDSSSQNMEFNVFNNNNSSAAGFGIFYCRKWPEALFFLPFYRAFVWKSVSIMGVEDGKRITVSQPDATWPLTVAFMTSKLNISASTQQQILLINQCSIESINTLIKGVINDDDYTRWGSSEPFVLRYFFASPDGLTPTYPTDKGYPDGGNPSGPGGGNGTFDGKSDLITVDALPNTPTIDFVHIWRLTLGQVKPLHTFLWGETFISAFRSLFQSPFECIIGIGWLPFLAGGSSATVLFGNVDSGVSAIAVDNQYYTHSFGGVQVEEYWGSFLDYNPHTTIHAYLPYIGMVMLDTDVIMGHQVNINYRFDTVTGACVALITLETGQLVATYSGNALSTLPLSVNDKSQAISNTLTHTLGMISGAVTENPLSVVSNAANLVLDTRTKPQMLGQFNTNVGNLLNKSPYLIIQRPIGSVPSQMAAIQGLRSNITKRIGDLSGYMRFTQIHLDGLSCLGEEKNMLESMLTGDGILSE